MTGVANMMFRGALSNYGFLVGVVGILAMKRQSPSGEFLKLPSHLNYIDVYTYFDDF